MKWGKYAGIAVLAVAIMMVGFRIGDWWEGRNSDKLVAELTTQLQKTSETLQITTGLYTKQSYAYQNLAKYISYKSDEMVALRKQLSDSQAQLLTANQLTLKWKKAYEGALDASQHPVDPCAPDSKTPLPCPHPTTQRVQVDFTGRLGPIKATGHTLTDPPEAFLKLEQVDPLKMTVAVAQNKDKTWSTFVTSSDPNLDVQIDLAGVNPLVISPKWYQRIWMDLGAAALGDPAGYVGLSWRGDRYSVGAMCYAAAGSMNGCGATLGVRLFK